MADLEIIPKYYVYGCDQLLTDIKEIMESAARAEESGLTSNEWLDYQGLESMTKNLKNNISWGGAIKILLINRTHELQRIRDEQLIDDFPY